MKKNIYYVYYVWLINRKMDGYYGWLIIENKISTMSIMSGLILKKISLLCLLINRKINGYYGWLIIEKKSLLCLLCLAKYWKKSLLCLLCLAKYWKKDLYYVYYVWLIIEKKSLLCLLGLVIKWKNKWLLWLANYWKKISTMFTMSG